MHLTRIAQEYSIDLCSRSFPDKSRAGSSSDVQLQLQGKELVMLIYHRHPRIAVLFQTVSNPLCSFLSSWSHAEMRRLVANEGLFYNHLLALPLFFIRFDEM
jgi:hypothetical protein